MSFDPTLPSSLKEMQTWFGKALEKDLFDGKDSELFLRDGPFLTASERFQIYHQLYWWRLQNSLRNKYLMAVAYLGDERFSRECAIPYFNQNPPKNWSLYDIGESFPEWLEEHYLDEEDKELIIDSCHIDRALMQAFVAPEFPKIQGPRLVLQPFVKLFSLPYDLLSIRKKIIEGEVTRPQKGGTCYFIIFRSNWKLIEEEKFQLLSLFKTPKTLDEAFEEIPDGLVDQLLPTITKTFQHFTSMNWITCLN